MIGTTNAVGSGGGLKSTDAILRVIAPAGSTVTISKGSVSKSDAGHENASDPTLYDYYFIIHASQFDSVNPWTVTASRGDATRTNTIIIDTADEYDITFTYGYYLVYDGVLINSITSSESSSDIRQQTGYVQLYGSSNEVCFSSTDPIDLTNYSTAVVEIVGSNSASANSGKFPCIGIAATRPSYSGSTISDYTKLNSASGAISAGVYTLDISTFTGNYYLCALVKYIGTNNYGRFDTVRFGVE